MFIFKVSDRGTAGPSSVAAYATGQSKAQAESRKAPPPAGRVQPRRFHYVLETPLPLVLDELESGVESALRDPETASPL